MASLGERARSLLAATLLAGFPSLLGAVQDPPAVLPAEPEATLQKEAEKWVRDKYKIDYAKKSPADLQSLAHKLLVHGTEVTGDLPMRYVLLREARDVSIKSGELDIAFAAADALAKSFAVDWGTLRMGILAKGAAAFQGADGGRTLALAYLEVVEYFVRKDAYESAQAALQKAETAAKSSQDPALASLVQDRRAETKTFQLEYAKVKPEIDKKEEGDALLIGKFYSFTKGEWTRGLPLLEQSSAAELKTPAMKDRGNPAEPMLMAEVGDLWWDLGATERYTRWKDRIQGRAVFWYRKAQADLTGKLQTRTQDRVKSFEVRSLGNEVECVPGLAYRTRGLTLLPSAGDGLYEIGVRKGRPCALMQNNGTDGRCLYFDIADGWAEKDGSVEILVEYLDGSAGTSLYVDYYATELGAQKEDYKSSDVVILGGSNAWKTASFRLPQVYFRNRFVNSDFRVVSIGVNLAIHRVAVRRK
jgi:hypothetical protein